MFNMVGRKFNEKESTWKTSRKHGYRDYTAMNLSMIGSSDYTAEFIELRVYWLLDLNLRLRSKET